MQVQTDRQTADYKGCSLVARLQTLCCRHIMDGVYDRKSFREIKAPPPEKTHPFSFIPFIRSYDRPLDGPTCLFILLFQTKKMRGFRCFSIQRLIFFLPRQK